MIYAVEKFKEQQYLDYQIRRLSDSAVVGVFTNNGKVKFIRSDSNLTQS
jgi:hypothetical protein